MKVRELIDTLREQGVFAIKHDEDGNPYVVASTTVDEFDVTLRIADDEHGGLTSGVAFAGIEQGCGDERYLVLDGSTEDE